jgi:purine-cytosine permease-like protein
MLKQDIEIETAPPALKIEQVEEYERTPVPENKTKDFRSFVNLVTGEHIAGTEFVIGPLFVLHGVAAFDVVLGLLIGNFLAVLSWVYICAPIAVKTRLTNFYLLEKICGYRLVSLYNGINALQSCVVSASMIAVSATAVGIGLGVEVPGIMDVLPNSYVWVLLVLGIGSVITLVAVYGYDTVAKFSGIFAPWMPLIFIAGALAVLPQLGVNSISDFWEVANNSIWTGNPQAGKSKYTIWHIIFFSWLCNSAMHIGLSDMSIYRYAKKANYAFASAVGMYIGHGMAWLCSGVLCAVALRNGNANPSPGEIASYSCGLAGIFCVIIAGWTTANPSIYRAGLALNGIFPNVKRWKLTLYIGLLAIFMSVFPGVISKLDQILAFYALVAAPVGAVIFLDVYFFAKWGLQANYAEKRNLQFNKAVALTWLISMLACYLLYVGLGLDFFFFMAIPGWFLAAILYYIFSRVFQKNEQI